VPQGRAGRQIDKCLVSHNNNANHTHTRQVKNLVVNDFHRWLSGSTFQFSEDEVRAYCRNPLLRHFLMKQAAKDLVAWVAKLRQKPYYGGWQYRLRDNAHYTLPLLEASHSGSARMCHNHDNGCLTAWPPHLKVIYAQKTFLYRGRWYCFGCDAFWQ